MSKYEEAAPWIIDRQLLEWCCKARSDQNALVLFAMVDTGLGNALAPFVDGNRNVERAERCNRFCQSHAVVNLQFQVSSSPNANAESSSTKKLTRYFDHLQ